MDSTNKNSHNKSDLKSFQEHESSLKQLLDRVAQDLDHQNIDIEVFDNNKISEALTEFIEPSLIP